MNIDKYSVSLKELIDHDDKFYAHSEGNRVETINEHIELCIKELMPLKDKPFYALDEKHPYKDLLTEFLNRNG